MMVVNIMSIIDKKKEPKKHGSLVKKTRVNLIRVAERESK